MAGPAESGGRGTFIGDVDRKPMKFSVTKDHAEQMLEDARAVKESGQDEMRVTFEVSPTLLERQINKQFPDLTNE